MRPCLRTAAPLVCFAPYRYYGPWSPAPPGPPAPRPHPHKGRGRTGKTLQVTPFRIRPVGSASRGRSSPHPPSPTGLPSTPPQRARSDRERLAGYDLPDLSGRCQQGKEQPHPPSPTGPPSTPPTRGAVGPGRLAGYNLPDPSGREFQQGKEHPPIPPVLPAPRPRPHKGRVRTGKDSQVHLRLVRRGIPARERGTESRAPWRRLRLTSVRFRGARPTNPPDAQTMNSPRPVPTKDRDSRGLRAFSLSLPPPPPVPTKDRGIHGRGGGDQRRPLRVLTEKACQNREASYG